MHTKKPQDNRPHLGIEFEHYMPGEMNILGAVAIYDKMPKKIRSMVDYSYELLNHGGEKGYEAKLCTPQEEYIPNLTSLIEFLREMKAITRPTEDSPRFGFHVHVDLRKKDYNEVNAVSYAFSKSMDKLLKYVDPVRVKRKYYGPEVMDRGYQTLEVRVMDSNFDLEKRIIPYIDEIINIKEAVA
jgi:hypothetical protein